MCIEPFVPYVSRSVGRRGSVRAFLVAPGAWLVAMPRTPGFIDNNKVPIRLAGTIGQ